MLSGNENKLKHRRFCPNIRENIFYCEGGRALTQVAERGFGDIQKTPGHDLGQLTLGGLT